jgi:hypothetical protein
MLAARGVSLGLGRINLSDLNQLPKADRALLGKLKREQKAEQKAREQKVVVRKHVDAKVSVQISYFITRPNMTFS